MPSRSSSNNVHGAMVLPECCGIFWNSKGCIIPLGRAGGSWWFSGCWEWTPKALSCLLRSCRWSTQKDGSSLHFGWNSNRGTAVVSWPVGFSWGFSGRRYPADSSIDAPWCASSLKVDHPDAHPECSGTVWIWSVFYSRRKSVLISSVKVGVQHKGILSTNQQIMNIM